MLSLTKTVFTEFIEKKSKFKTRLFSVESEKEVSEILDLTRKEEKSASHNCYAYRIYSPHGLLERKNDDGEPGGTAGAPMLSVLQGKDLVNVLVVVTRYFGGIKLGTGGLVSAYKKGARDCVEFAEKNNLLKEFIVRKKYSLIFLINETEKINYLISTHDLVVKNKQFTKDVIYTMLLGDEEKKFFKKYNLELIK